MDVAYFRYLLRTVPPAAIARAAALRLGRAAPRVTPGAPRPTELLAAFDAAVPAVLPSRLARPVAGPLALAAPARIEAAMARLKVLLPMEHAAGLALAQASLDRRIVIFGAAASLPASNRVVPHASPGYVAIDWEADPFTARPALGPAPAVRDIKVSWALGRLEQVVHLAAGAVLAAERDSSRELADAALDRALDLASAPQGVQWTSPLEVAARATNLAIALRLLAGHRSLAARPAALLAILQSVVFHARWVGHHLEELDVVPNNHLVGNLTGLLAVGALLPQLSALIPSPARAAAALQRELFRQTLRDGMSFEGSVPYHRLAVELFALGELCAASIGAPFSPAARGRLAQLFAASRELLDGRGLTPQIGDNDSQRALPFRPRHPQEQAYLLPLGAARFDRPDLKLPGSEPSVELLWLLGTDGLRHFSRLPAGTRAQDSSLRHAGIHLLRSRRFSLAVSAGPNGTGGTGGHGHNDKLGVEICLDGRLLVGDPGTFTYTGDAAARNRFRGTGLHSTVMVDGEEQQPLPEGRLFALPELAGASCLALESTARRGRLVLEHHGYQRLTPPVLHRRELVLQREAEAEAILLADSLTGSGAHRAQVHFLLPTLEVRLVPLDGPARERLALSAPPEAAGWDLAHAVEVGPAGAPWAFLAGAGAVGAPALTRAAYSPGYLQREPATLVTFELAGELPLNFWSAVLPAERGAGGAGKDGAS